METTEEKIEHSTEQTTKHVWSHEGDSYFLSDVSQVYDELPVGVYRLEKCPKRGLYLKAVSPSFTFGYKIYGLEEKFIKRVATTYNSTEGNMGVILNGVKGTGKSVTAKQIANALELPVMVVPHFFEELPDFINDIQQDMVVFIDEYEKIYIDWKTTSILTVMDGVLTNEHRKFFLLTTNELRIDKNLLQRPTRIRYVKTYDNLGIDVVKEIVDDMLEHKQHKDETIKFISEMDIITMDLVKALISEINIHNEPPSAFADIFNVRSYANELYDIYDASDSKDQKLLLQSTKMDFVWTAENVGRRMYFNDTVQGDMLKAIDKDLAIFECWEEDPDTGDEKPGSRGKRLIRRELCNANVSLKDFVF